MSESKSTFSPAELNERMIHRRAVEAVIWGMPAVNYELMFRQLEKLGGGFNQIVYWSRLLDWKNQTLTPNPDVIYLMPFFNTQDDGPIVLEIPPADDGILNGSVMDYWQAAIEDIGPGGVDKGKGGKYLFTPPDFPTEQVPEGYIALPSDTWRRYALVRSILKSGSDQDVADAIAYSKRIKLYPLSEAANPQETIYIDAADALFDSTIPYDIRFFESLDRVVQWEPLLERDRGMIDQLKTVGIERGKPFAPSAATRAILENAVVEARDWMATLWERITPFYPGKQWTFPVTEELHQSFTAGFSLADSYPVAERGNLYTFIFFSAKHAGQAQYYLMATQGSDGSPLWGDATYRLHVPANAPVTQYWSVTVYDRATHAFIRNARWMGRSSQTPGLQRHEDGSTNIYFGPAAPAGKETNWIPTNPGGSFEVLARFYGPQKALFDKSWQLSDLEKSD